MVSNQILQNTIDGLFKIAHVPLMIVDTDGKIIVSTEDRDENIEKLSLDFVASSVDSQEVQGYQFFKIYEEVQLEYILIVTGTGENTQFIGSMVSFQLQSLLIAYKERFDKDNFVKNLILDNLLLVDIYSRAKKLRIETSAKRLTMIVATGKRKDNSGLEAVRRIIGGSKDFVTAVDEKSVIVVIEIQDGTEFKSIDKLAKKLINTLSKEGFEGVRIAYGTIVNEIKEVSRSYKEAKMALDVGKIFFEDKNIIAYSELGIGRLIYQLPMPLCKMFISEIFQDKSPDNFDVETLSTINKFFENSLNVSETSRQLFIHRNTLVYRLDKLQKSTGLDLRIFEDAITFKIALMVVKYMKNMEKYEY